MLPLYAADRRSSDHIWNGWSSGIAYNPVALTLAVEIRTTPRPYLFVERHRTHPDLRDCGIIVIYH